VEGDASAHHFFWLRLFEKKQLELPELTGKQAGRYRLLDVLEELGCK